MFFASVVFLKKLTTKKNKIKDAELHIDKSLLYVVSMHQIAKDGVQYD